MSYSNTNKSAKPASEEKTNSENSSKKSGCGCGCGSK